MITKNLIADVQRLFDSGAHFAQVKSRRHPSMKPFIIGTKGQQEIIDLGKTNEQISAAKTVMSALAREGKIVLFVGGKVEIASLVKKAAKDINAPYIASRWLGGTISNWDEIKKRIDRLAEILEKRDSGILAKQHTKLELIKIERERIRLSRRLDGITTLLKRPDAMVIVDTKHEKHAVKEANSFGIPVIAIMSSDCDIKDATYPIVANDTSRKTVELILSELTEAFAQGRAS